MKHLEPSRSPTIRAALALASVIGVAVLGGGASGCRGITRSENAREANDEQKLVDLTHAFSERSVYWPTAHKFELKRVAWGPNADGEWYASNDFSASEHGGTHLDAPIHFAEDGMTSERIPVDRFFGPARVVDVTEECAVDPDYVVSAEDILAHERKHGRIEPGAIVLVRTGFGERYPDLESYLGSAVRGSIEGLHFPGFGVDAARVLVERRVDMVGLDTASLDHGPSAGFDAHRVFAEAQIPGLENVANLDKVPPVGARVIALPMKIEGGTGGPCRIVAILP